MAEGLGKPLMPWQRMVADVGGEIDPDTGLPAYRDVVMTVPRQHGKTVLILGWEIQRALGWGGGQKIVYSAQTGNDARKKLIEDQIPLLDGKRSRFGITQILKGMGNEGIVFKGGSRLVLMASGDDAGHGKTVHLGVKDEFWNDFDDRRDQALGPAMLTIADAQNLTASTAGTDASVPFNQLVARGRQAVDAGKRSGIAYFEWSADPGCDPDDPRVWWETMPALGMTITEQAVRHLREVTFADRPDEFLRSCLNIPTRNDERLIPALTWDLVNAPDVAPVGQVVFGADVSIERTSAAIVACGGKALEVVEHRPQLGWFVETAVEIDRATPGAVWVVDGSGPIGSYIDDLKRAGLQVTILGPKDMAAASGAFFDAVVNRAVRVRRHPSMDAAVAGAAKRAVGEQWTFARKSSADDISPLIAATAALRVEADAGGDFLF